MVTLKPSRACAQHTHPSDHPCYYLLTPADSANKVTQGPCLQGHMINLCTTEDETRPYHGISQRVHVGKGSFGRAMDDDDFVWVGGHWVELHPSQRATEDGPHSASHHVVVQLGGFRVAHQLRVPPYTRRHERSEQMVVAGEELIEAHGSLR
jgi:hypothetical protein